MSISSDPRDFEAQRDESPSKDDVSKSRSWSTLWGRSSEPSQRSFNMPSLKRKAATETVSDDTRLKAIELLFGLRDTTAQEWPGLHVLCSILEDNFEVLLRNDFDVIWRLLGCEKPTKARGCWNWCLAVVRIFQSLQTNESVSMEDVYKDLVNTKSVKPTPLEKDRILLAIFAVLCWTSMMLIPDLDLERIAESLTAADPCLSFRPKGIRTTAETPQTLLSQTSRRPIVKLFRTLRGIIKDPGIVGTAAGVTDTDTIHESSVNFFSLYTIGRVRVRWVEDLTSHLAFERQSRTLSVFCLPTFCVSSILRTEKIKIIQQVSSELFPASYYTDYADQDRSTLHREVLLTYRLLFGQSPRSRTLASTLIDQMKESSGNIDPFLSTICTASTTRSHFLRQSPNPELPAELFPTSSLDLNNCLIESDTYSSRDDFPHFGPRLLAVQQYNLRQQPSRVRDLWRDRRNPLQWYTFWAVLWVGGITIVLGALQLAAAILQAYYSVTPEKQ